MSESRFDLAGFRGGGDSGRTVDVPPPPPPRHRTHEEPAPAPDDSGPSPGRSAGRRSKAKPKHSAQSNQARVRVTTNVPAALARRAKERAEGEGLYLSDLVLAAFGTHHEEVRKQREAPWSPGAGLPPRARRRRRRVADPTQFVLYLTGEELEVIDELATSSRVSRSELVSTLLELELGPDGESR